jgi:maltose phosphorylase
MKQYLQLDPWSIIEEGFDPHNHEISESIFSIGNGRMGQRANFEETYTGSSLQGSYVAGVYYPDKTRVGWWKNGYPEYFAKVLNAANWIGINIELEGEMLDLAKCEVSEFRRELNMKAGYLQRTCTVKTATGKIIKIDAKRFCSFVDDECGAIRYAVKSENFAGKMTVTNYVDGDIKNKDSNYDEKFWNNIATSVKNRSGIVVLETKKTAFQVATGMKFDLLHNGKADESKAKKVKREKYIACKNSLTIKAGDEVVVFKYGANLSSENHPKAELAEKCRETLKKVAKKGFDTLLAEHTAAWASKWQDSDITIEGDVAAQQGIRFNIFHMNQTYTGEDERLNIGPKGFTGEKYGGSTYWDTEAYCLPFYLATAEERVARQLLVYRYKQLGKAIENAAKLGFTDGAALYPMVTMNGEECHNEWEITFEEIHRNGAIAYGIYDYVRYTGDEAYLSQYGAEVLLGIARFWSQRINWSEQKKKYVMLGVTGPNEYDNNVSNNWYTNYIATWCLEYADYALDYVQKNDVAAYQNLVEKTNWQAETELERWRDIRKKMYFPSDKKLGVYLQQEDYLDKEQILVKDLDPKHLPLNQKWSWDRILRSCFIKQADVLQGIYFFEERFKKDEIERNFDFYEPRTVHESSLSPCVHVILAATLDKQEKAYEMYLRTSRLDLDNYNNDTEDGLHITSMAGTWMSVVKGFGGMRVQHGKLHFRPFLPSGWASFAFKVRFRNSVVEVKATQTETVITNLSKNSVSVVLFGKETELDGGRSIAAVNG